MSLNLTTIAIIWLAGSVILLPLMILTVRLAIVPLLETITRSGAAPRAASTEARIASLEEKVGRLGRELERLARGNPAHNDA